MIKLVELIIEEDGWIGPYRTINNNIPVADLERPQYLLEGGKLLTKNQLVEWWNRASSNFEFDFNSIINMQAFIALVNSSGVLCQWEYFINGFEQSYFWWLEGFTKSDLLIMLLSPTPEHRQVAKLLLDNDLT